MTSKGETDLFPWILFGLLALVVGVLGISYTRQTIPRDSAAFLPTAAPAPRQPMAPVRAPRSTADPVTRYWECVQNGQRIFSDTPCGNQASSRTVSAINRMPAEQTLPPTLLSVSPPSRDPPETPNRFDDPRTDSAECEYMKQEINAINERTRHRYTIPEGNYFRGRLHEIDDRQSALNCKR